MYTNMYIYIHKGRHSKVVGTIASPGTLSPPVWDLPREGFDL